MEYVQKDGIYRGILLTADRTSIPEQSAWPDDDIVIGDVVATIAGVIYAGTKTVTKQAEIGKHIITLDCTGVPAGSVIEISGEYYIDSIRYWWAAEIYVSADVVAATGASPDAKKARQFITNDRTREVVSATQWRYTILEDDGSTTAFRVDFNPVTGNTTAV